MRILGLSALLSLTFFLSGCIDIYQHITSSEKNKTSIYTRISISKTVIAMANGMSGNQESFDYDKWFKEKSGTDIVAYNGVVPIESEKINSELEFGVSYRASISYSEKLVQDLKKIDEGYFFPIIDKGTISIKTHFEKNDGTEQSNQMGAAFMSTAYYTITLDKSVKKKIVTVNIVREEKKISCSFEELDDQFYVRIPIILLLNGDSTIEIR